MDTIISVKDLSIQFGGLKAVDEVSFSIQKDEIFGLIGPNGAGKTTVFNMLSGFYQADSGESFSQIEISMIINHTPLTS